MNLSDFNMYIDHIAQGNTKLQRDHVDQIVEISEDCKIIAISDLEGRMELLLGLLSELNIIEIESSTTTIKWKDFKVYVIVCGDLIDDYRWKHEEQQNVSGYDIDILFICDYMRRISNNRFMCVMGNHDLLLHGILSYKNYSIRFSRDLKFIHSYIDYNEFRYTILTFISTYITPFILFPKLRVLSLSGTYIIMSHAGIDIKYIKAMNNTRSIQDELTKILQTIHTFDTKMNFISDDELKIELYKDTEKPNSTLTLHDIVDERTLQTMCQHDKDSSENIEISFNNNKKIIQLTGHNKNKFVRVMLSNDNGDNQCVTHDNMNNLNIIEYPYITCIVDALQNAFKPQNATVIQIENNMLKTLTKNIGYKVNTNAFREVCRKLYTLDDELLKLYKNHW